jgi:OOP family OmpA-OmpF porin
MSKRILFYLIFFSPAFAVAQINLVPNPSFEIYNTCPNSGGQITYATGWFTATLGSPDYFNSCSAGYGVPSNGFGYSNAQDGNAYAGEVL